MAILNGVNFAKVQAEPSQKIPVAEITGSVRSMYDSHTFAADVNAIGDVIKLCQPLQKGARILRATVKSPSLGTTGIMTLGNAANGVDSADPDSLVAGIDAGGQAVLGKETAASALLGKKLEADTQFELVFTEASDAAEGKTVEVWIEYVLD